MRRALCILLAVAAAACIVPAGAAASGAPVTAVESVGIVVRDLDRALRFYTDVLSFERVSEVEVTGDAYAHLEGVFGLRLKSARLRLGEEVVDLLQYTAPEGRSVPEDARSNDRSFQHIAIVVSDMQRAYRTLREHAVGHASSGPQKLPSWNPNAGGIEAFYFKDPDGHALEVIHFPPGKGDPRWQRATDRIFLGIDHTAIVVSDTEASLGLYRDRLGMRVAGESENYGTEQEHLNNVFGARLRITALRAAAGPGIELLEYLAPGDGRDSPADSRSNDLWSWQTRLVTEDCEGTARDARAAGARWVSPGGVKVPDRALGISEGALARDADGHALLFIEK